MKKFLLIFLLGVGAKTYAQRLTEEFTIKIPEKIVANSLYDSLHLVDLRDDTLHMGIVQKGAFNRKARVVAEPALGIQMAGLVKNLTDATARHGQLEIVLRQMSFAEVTTMTERGYYYLRADLYANTGSGYTLLDKIDTVVMVKSMDVTKATLRNGSKHITKFIEDNLLAAPNNNGPAYIYYELTRLDSMEKRQLPLYTATTLSEGVYDNYNSFKNQQPNRLLFTVKEKDGQVSAVSILNEKNKYEKVNAKELYAVVYKGKPYIASPYGYYALTKQEDDWYFNGKYKTAASTGKIMAAGFFFGIIGAAIAADAGSTEEGEMKLDHTSGAFEVVDPAIKK